MANTLWDKLEAKFNELKAQLTASASAAPAAAPVADHSKTISDFRAQLDGFKAELEAKDGEIVTLKASQTDFDAKVATAASAKALEITASLGVPPVKAPVPAAQADNVKTRTEFSAMSPEAQTKFCLAGGKLTN